MLSGSMIPQFLKTIRTCADMGVLIGNAILLLQLPVSPYSILAVFGPTHHLSNSDEKTELELQSLSHRHDCNASVPSPSRIVVLHTDTASLLDSGAKTTDSPEKSLDATS